MGKFLVLLAFAIFLSGCSIYIELEPYTPPTQEKPSTSPPPKREAYQKVEPVKTKVCQFECEDCVLYHDRQTSKSLLVCKGDVLLSYGKVRHVCAPPPYSPNAGTCYVPSLLTPETQIALARSSCEQSLYAQCVRRPASRPEGYENDDF